MLPPVTLPARLRLPLPNPRKLPASHHFFFLVNVAVDSPAIDEAPSSNCELATEALPDAFFFLPNRDLVSMADGGGL